MKRAAIFLGTLLCFISVSAQVIRPDSSFNWMMHTVYSDSIGTVSATDLAYYNGLGLKEQVIQVSATDAGKSIVKPYTYDKSLRMVHDYLTYPLDEASYTFRENAVEELEAYCRAAFKDGSPYILTDFESIPGGRPISITMPGSDYHSGGHQRRISYGSNAYGEIRNVSVGTDGSLIANGYYSAGKVAKETSLDEDGCLHIVYKDCLGNILLDRRSAGDTYYIYDHMYRLRYVMPPEASAMIANMAETHTYSSYFCQTYCYSYQYDKRRRMIIRRLPQRGEEYFVYDECDREIARQDAADKARGIWRTIEYDKLGRVVKEGHLSSVLTRETLQANPSVISGAVADVTYTYDFYPESVPSGLEFIAESEVLTAVDRTNNTKGLVTYMTIREYDADTSLSGDVCFRTYYYDYLGRPIQIAEMDSDGNVYRSSSRYDFNGNVVAQMETMSGLRKKSIYDYDARNRLKSASYIVGNGSSYIRYGYHDNGLLMWWSDMKASIRCQYRYDIAGRRTGQTVLYGTVAEYADTLRYHKAYNGSVPSWTGNVSSWTWSKWRSVDSETYMFEYDKSGRLTSAKSIGPDGAYGNRFAERYSYDRNGNILTLHRYDGNAQVIDGITNTYIGNRMAGNAYDPNGNVSYDASSGLSMEWNHLNLIKKVSDNSGVLVNYSYLADGTKVRAVDADGEGLEYRGSLTFRRAADGTLTPESAIFPCGRFMAVTGSTGNIEMEPYFHITDHLGSIRMILSGNSSIPFETGQYYPLGQRWQTDCDFYEQSNRYRYNGKEEQAPFGTPYIDYGARQYSAVTGRWLAMDPMAEKYYNVSPYAFCNNNPINYVDPDGKFPDIIWDAASIGMGISNLVQNVQSGNVRGAVGDGVGIVIDAVAAAVPFIPGGVGAVRTGAKAAKSVDVTTVDKVVQAVNDVGNALQTKKPGDKTLNILPENQIDRGLLDKPTKRGNAFVFKNDGSPVEIHHVDQSTDGPYVEMHMNDHRGKGNYKENHPKSSENSRIDRQEFAKQRRIYWQKEYDKYYK